nr:DnaB helicase C-terminal domain-containing protein [Acidobacteriota bacterium]
TALALQIAFHVAQESPALYLTFENSPDTLLLQALCSRAYLNPRDVLRGYADLESLETAAAELRPRLAARVALVAGDGHLTAGEIKARARRLLAEHEARSCLVVVDYLQLMAKTSHALRGWGDARARVEALAGELIALSRELESPVLALSSQSRAGGSYGRSGGSDALDSLKESGDLEYSADVALFLESRDRKAPPSGTALELSVRKQRSGPTGSVGLVFLPDRRVLRERCGRGWVGACNAGRRVRPTSPSSLNRRPSSRLQCQEWMRSVLPTTCKRPAPRARLCACPAGSLSPGSTIIWSRPSSPATRSSAVAGWWPSLPTPPMPTVICDSITSCWLM